jgi:fatty-acyl-CoA synthase
VRSLRGLRTGLTIGRPDEVVRVVDELGIDGICNIYGLTEVFGNCCVTDADDDVSVRVASQGLPLPGVELRIVGEAGTVLPCGEAGQIEVRGRVMPGYLAAANGGEPASSPFTADGWFMTGDTGRLRTDGRLEFVGRHSEMIKTSGINVSPAEIEAHLRTHPLIDEAAVVGVNDPVKGEVPVAFVVCAEPVSEAACIAFCRSALSAYKIPARVIAVAALPQTPTGKLARKTLLTMVPSSRSPA